MLTQLQTQLTRLAPHQREFLIGLSGGVDSVVLLHLFSQLRPLLGLKLRAIHIHHGISPNADQWRQFCQDYCAQLAVPFLSERVKVSGKNLEAEARQARYQAIGKHIFAQEMFVTAHHQDDQAETLLLALKRGSGVKGLSAMQGVSFWQNFTILRPFLNTSKTAILAYAKAQQLAWVRDESNNDNHYDRNFLRNQVLPLLNNRWHFTQMVARTAQHCAEQQALLEELLSEELHRRCHRNCFDIQGFANFSRPKQRQLIRLWLAKLNQQMPSQERLDQILHQMVEANLDKHPQFPFGNGVLRRYQSRLYFTPPFADSADTASFTATLSAGEEALTLPDGIGTILRQKGEICGKFPHKTDRLLLPKALESQTVTIKLTHSGKTARYGQAQREEMKKIYQQHGIPPWLRTRTPLLFIGEIFLGLLSAME
ncbi:tRNA(Ile)-lysidine synthase [Pasteurellaceae bacterium Macca]|nr:tRNA(Ile)-lysidine synthase [Pasteurellaceae bacterium Macca]